MKARVKLFRSDGGTGSGFPVKLIVTHQGKTARAIIGYSSLEYWDELRQLPKAAHPDFMDLYGRITDINRLALTNIFRSYNDIPAAMNYLQGIVPAPGKSMLVLDYFEKEIDYLKSAGRLGTAGNYKIAASELKKYDPGVTFEKITPAWLNSFKRHKSMECNNTTLKTHLGVFRALYNKAVLDPVVQLEDKKPFINVMRGVSVRRGRVKNRYLDAVVIKRLEEVIFDHPGDIPAAEIRSLSLGLLQFYLGGAALKDVYYLRWDQFYKDRVILQRAKLGRIAFEYDVKVFEKTKILLNKIGVPGGDYVFPFSKEYNDYKMFRTNCNRSLRRIQQRLQIEVNPKGGYLNSYTFRHTFATLGKFAFIDPDILRELMGHERGDVDTIYKDRYPEAVRDAAHAKIIGG